MNIKMNILPIITMALLLLAVSAPVLRAQDIHFSQVDLSPILYNPAYSGFFDGSGRFGVAYRNQWASVTKPFQTTAATGEFSLVRRRYNRDGLNLGVVLFNDKAGSLHYGTFAANAMISYFKAIGRDNNNFISGAIEFGVGQAGFDPSEANPYDPSEVYENSSEVFPTVGCGLAWFYQPSDRFYIKLGASGHNLNSPSLTFLNQEGSNLNRRYNIYARAEFRNQGSVAFQPLVTLQLQKNFTEPMAGMNVKWYIEEGLSKQLAIDGGLFYRYRDAIILSFGVEYNSFLFGVSYDANISRLLPASHSLGSVEFQTVYRMRKREAKRKALPCPII